MLDLLSMPILVLSVYNDKWKQLSIHWLYEFLKMFISFLLLFIKLIYILLLLLLLCVRKTKVSLILND